MVDFMEPMITKLSFEKWSDSWLTEFLAIETSKEGHFQEGPKTSWYFGDLEKR